MTLFRHIVVKLNNLSKIDIKVPFEQKEENLKIILGTPAN